MIVLGGTLKILDPNRNEVLQAFNTLQELSRSEEQGPVVYHFSVDLNDENLIYVYEEWDSVESLKAHGQQEHMDPFRALRTDKRIEVVRFSRWRAEELGQF